MTPQAGKKVIRYRGKMSGYRSSHNMSPVNAIPKFPRQNHSIAELAPVLRSGNKRKFADPKVSPIMSRNNLPPNKLKHQLSQDDIAMMHNKQKILNDESSPILELPPKKKKPSLAMSPSGGELRDTESMFSDNRSKASAMRLNKQRKIKQFVER
jgi:hypothetical protein